MTSTPSPSEPLDTLPAARLHRAISMSLTRPRPTSAAVSVAAVYPGQVVSRVHEFHWQDSYVHVPLATAGSLSPIARAACSSSRSAGQDPTGPQVRHRTEHKRDVAVQQVLPVRDVALHHVGLARTHVVGKGATWRQQAVGRPAGRSFSERGGVPIVLDRPVAAVVGLVLPAEQRLGTLDTVVASSFQHSRDVWRMPQEGNCCLPWP